MSNYRRPRVTGASIFFSVALAGRGGDILLRHADALREAVTVTRNERPFGIDAFVVLPDHVHAVWTLPPGDRDYGTRWGAIKARFTRAVKSSGRVGLHPTNGATVGCNPTLRRSRSKVKKGDAGVWQRRFWEHHIRDQADFAAHIRYCWMNPVKHGLVERAVDWPLSSIHRDIRRGMVEPDWAGMMPEGQFGE